MLQTGNAENKQESPVFEHWHEDVPHHTKVCSMEGIQVLVRQSKIIMTPWLFGNCLVRGSNVPQYWLICFDKSHMVECQNRNSKESTSYLLYEADWEISE